MRPSPGNARAILKRVPEHALSSGGSLSLCLLSRACSLTCFSGLLCLLSFQALVGFASRGHCLFSRSFLAGIASFFPILQLLFRRFFFDRFLLNPGFLPLRTLYSLVPGLGFSKFVARLECRDFSCDLGGSARFLSSLIPRVWCFFLGLWSHTSR